MAFAENSVLSFNQSALNSESTPRLRLLNAIASKNPSSGDLNTDHNRLKISNDGYFDDVLAQRNLYGADLVSLISLSSNYCGYGTLVGYFTTVSKNCSIGNLSFAHEVGHNLGAHHDIENYTASGYNHGHRFYGSDGVLYRTVMSYAPGARMAFFSNPLLLFQGTPTGVESVSENARKITETAQMIANLNNPKTPSINPHIELSSSSVNFGNVNLGSSRTYSIVISNSGINDLNVSQFNLSSSDFNVSTDCIKTYLSGESCSLQITFTPSSAKSYAEQLLILSNSETGDVTIALTGTGVDPNSSPTNDPILVADSSRLDFGDVAIGAESSLSLKVSNNGGGSLSVTSMSISNENFSVAHNCNSLMTNSQSCTVTVTFSPLSSGRISSKLDINSTSGSISISLSGRGISGSGGGGGRSGGGKGNK